MGTHALTHRGCDNGGNNTCYGLWTGTEPAQTGSKGKNKKRPLVGRRNGVKVLLVQGGIVVETCC